MKFYGLSKVTLIDFPDKVACTVFTHGCDLRCPFCHNPELVTGNPQNIDSITQQDLIKFLKSRINKLDGVVFTGGEPLLHRHSLIKVIKSIKDLGFEVKLDTNGTMPDVLSNLIKSNLVDFVAMDFKCSPHKYTGIMKASPKMADRILESLGILRSSSTPYEIRTTVVPGIHDNSEMKTICSLIKGVRHYSIQNFVPNGTVDPNYKDVTPFALKKIKEFSKIARGYVEEVEIRNID